MSLLRRFHPPPLGATADGSLLAMTLLVSCVNGKKPNEQGKKQGQEEDGQYWMVIKDQKEAFDVMNVTRSHFSPRVISRN